MFSINEYRAPSRKGLRSFGFVLAVGFFVVGMIPVIFRHASPGRLALSLSVFFAVTGLLVPNSLRYIHRVWMLLGSILGWINSRIILSLIFYIVVTPVRFLMSVTGRDPMNRNFDSKTDSYRVVRTPRDVSHMNHQF